MFTEKYLLGCEELVGLYEQGIITKKELNVALGSINPNDNYIYKIIKLVKDGTLTKEALSRAFEKTTSAYNLIELFKEGVITAIEAKKRVGNLEKRSLYELLKLHEQGIISKKEARKRLGLK